MSRFFGRWARTDVAAGLLGGALAAQAETVMPGSANPNLAGRAPGYECCSGDSVSGQAAVLAAVVLIAIWLGHVALQRVHPRHMRQGIFVFIGISGAYYLIFH